jgi:hypothetical protein
VPTTAKRVAKPRRTRVGVNRRGRPLRSLPGRVVSRQRRWHAPASALGIGGHNTSQVQRGRPARVAHPRRRPAQGLFHEAYLVCVRGRTCGSTPSRGAREVRLALPAPPQPELLGLAGLPGQLAHLDQDHSAPQPRVPACTRNARLSAGSSGAIPRPTPNAHRAVVVAFAAMFAGRLRPTRGRGVSLRSNLLPWRRGGRPTGLGSTSSGAA